MGKYLGESVFRQKSEMYAMILAIEEDFIDNLYKSLRIEDVSPTIISSAIIVKEETDQFLSILRGLGIQSYIEICNDNIAKLAITISQKNFINKELSKIIPIRNAVMHPRPLGYFDYSMLKQVFNDINVNLQCFMWNNVHRTRRIISEHPETLLPPPSNMKKSEHVIENLPVLIDYEETSFIGRKKEIGEIRAQLNRKNVNILSVIGDGGVGKTAITLKLLYEMLDEDDCQYDLIIWTSLKTNELSNSEFLEIRDSISSVTDMYKGLSGFIGSIERDDPQELLIELAKSFRTLFVLDNLETINTTELKDFFDRFSEHGKVLITSRIGLGEMEHRYKLGGLNSEDVKLYADTLLSLYGFECLFTDEQKDKIVQSELHSNPLAIKWFVRCLYNGQSVEEVLSHKEDLINFCMANVYDKLSDIARDVLDVLSVSGTELTSPELMYYMGNDSADSIQITYAINELGKCNFIDESIFKLKNKISVTDFAREFLQMHFAETKYPIADFQKREQKLLAFGQKMEIRRSLNPYQISTIYFSNKSELVSALYLEMALQKAKNPEMFGEAIQLIDYAKLLTPKYFECNLILAELYKSTSPLKARNEYEYVINVCKNNDELIFSLLQYSDFLIRVNDYGYAIELLTRAEGIDPSCLDVKFQKAKAYSYIGKYEDAEELIKKLDISQLDDHFSNMFLTLKADLIRRRSELIDIRETKKRLYYVKEAFSLLEWSKNPDKHIYDYMVKLLVDLTYLHNDSDVLAYILEIVHKHYQQIKSTGKYRTFRSLMSDRLTHIVDTDFKKIMSPYILNYNDYLHLLNTNEALVYNLKDGYGFCKNRDFPRGIYFSKAGLPEDITFGDIIRYSGTVISKGRPSVIRATRIGNIDDRIMQNSKSKQ